MRLSYQLSLSLTTFFFSYQNRNLPLFEKLLIYMWIKTKNLSQETVVI